MAVTPEDVATGELVGHKVNTADPNYRSFVDACRDVMLAPQTAVEVEAISPPVLRQRLEEALVSLIDDTRAWNITVEAGVGAPPPGPDQGPSGKAVMASRRCPRSARCSVATRRGP